MIDDCLYCQKIMIKIKIIHYMNIFLFCYFLFDVVVVAVVAVVGNVFFSYNYSDMNERKQNRMRYFY